jgi:hypothetical protein
MTSRCSSARGGGLTGVYSGESCAEARVIERPGVASLRWFAAGRPDFERALRKASTMHPGERLASVGARA